MIKKFLILSLLTLSLQFFSKETDVIQLDAENFDKIVTESNDMILVLFYAPWCGHCKAFHPEYEKAAKALKGVFKIAALDADKNRDIGQRFGVRGFPTVKFFGLNRKTPDEYTGTRKATSIREFMFTKAKDIVDKRMGETPKKETEKPKTNTNTGNTGNAGNAGNQQKGNNNQAGMEDGVYILTDDNFDNLVFNDKTMWVIAFYAPWCGHCKKLLPEYNIAAGQLKGTIKLGKVDCTVQQKLASKYQIQGYPTIKIFSPGVGKDKQVSEWQGPRDAPGIVSYALDKLEKFGYVPETEQIIGEETIKSVCGDKVGICVISILPNIADSNTKERTNYLNIIKEVNKKQRGKPIMFLWAQGGDFFDFEDKLHLSFGYPAVVAINYKKKMYSIMRSSFNTEHLNEFISNLLIGKGSLSKFPDGIKMKPVTKWDGKDYKPTNNDL